jgi:transcriptional regulator with XRE-family HTH domain
MNIHQRIRRRREQLGLSMQALAERIPVRAWQTIQQWEKEGGTAPKRERLKAVAKALQTTEKWLMFGGLEAENAKSDDGRSNQQQQPLEQETAQNWPFSVALHDINHLPPNIRQRLDEFVRGFVEGALSSKGSVEDHREPQASRPATIYVDSEAAVRIETSDDRVIDKIPSTTHSQRPPTKKTG